MRRAQPVAVLTVPSLKLEVPVFEKDDDLSLNRGAGLVAGMGTPDQGGNVGIAGHRDGFFRVLKDIKVGDLIEVRTRIKVHRYRVTSIDIVDATDKRLLADTELPSHHAGYLLPVLLHRQRAPEIHRCRQLSMVERYLTNGERS